MIQIPKLLRSLTILVTFRLGIHIDLDVNQQILEVRHWSKQCLRQIQFNVDEQDQSQLFNIGYGRVITISLSTSGGVCEKQDMEIFYGLRSIYDFLREQHQGRSNYGQPSFQPLPLLA
ncbi:MAG: hypothetical protein EZS28_017545 [Streblomastix strix]|uniref:Uncharacterized protein n=1 Tax=Streblomastix strix TaxID=222440 RepID=A0A5J4VWK7_9EUKA|nr:MAG: hypothetical protein EZS28_017545 [Streblomastix strix]